MAELFGEDVGIVHVDSTRRGGPLLPTTDDNPGARLGMPISLCGQSKDDDSAMKHRLQLFTLFTTFDEYIVY